MMMVVGVMNNFIDEPRDEGCTHALNVTRRDNVNLMTRIDEGVEVQQALAGAISCSLTA
jgi:hypothetical protein